jgi:RNA ligase
MFPIIKNIDDILPAISNRKEFSVRQKEDGYTVINYDVVMEDTFPTPDTKDPILNNFYALRRECRGIVFHTKTGLLLRRPWHKFFNINERSETLEDKIDLSQSHWVMEKLDGSMIAPFVMDNEVIWASKAGGGTDVSTQVIEYLRDHDLLDLYNSYIKECDNKLTFLFEWCAPDNRIVVNYKEETLFLCGIRIKESGAYIQPEIVKEEADRNNMPFVGSHNTFNLEETKALEREEGRVLFFDTGQMYKAKSDWYLQLHKAKEYLQFEKYIWQICLNDTLDDFLPLIKTFSDEEADKLIKFNTTLQNAMYKKAEELQWEVYAAKDNLGKSKKKFALHIQKNFVKAEQGLLFSIYEAEDAYAIIKKYMLKNVSTAIKLENCKKLLKGEVKWIK